MADLELPEHSIPTPHLTAIGSLVVEFSQLEWLIEESIWRFAGLPDVPQGRAITTHMNLNARLDALKALVEDLAPEALNELIALDREIRAGRDGRPSLQSERARFVHGWWERGNDDHLVWTGSFRARGKVTSNVHTISAQEIMDVTWRVRGLHQRFWTWFMEHAPDIVT